MPRIKANGKSQEAAAGDGEQHDHLYPIRRWKPVLGSFFGRSDDGYAITLWWSLYGASAAEGEPSACSAVDRYTQQIA